MTPEFASALHTHFSFNSFRTRQAEVIQPLLQKGALTFPHPFKEPPVKLSDWMKEKAASLPSQPNQPSLF